MDIVFKYSTVDEYLATLNEQKYPVFEGDFLPYLQDVECSKCPSGRRIDHWSGYYSTRPNLKQEIR